MTARPSLRADVVALGELRPGATPTTRPAPEPVEPADWPAYRLAEPPGTGLFPRGQLRKLKRAQAMALSAVKLAVDSTDAVAAHDDVAVCVGTAWAEFGEELKFLETMIQRGEIGARPALFTNSVHNALASKIAIEFDWQSENHTFTHDAASFEHALWQAMALLDDGRSPHAVVCGADGLADFLELRGHLLGLFDTDSAPLEPLGGSTRKRVGTLPGEGSAAFVLAPAGRAAAPLARLLGVQTRGPGPLPATADLLGFLDVTVAGASIGLDDIDLVLLGANEDAALDPHYRELMDGFAPRLQAGARFAVYRHQTGDFATAAALGLASAVRTIHQQTIAPELCYLGSAQPPAQAPTTVLLVHLTARGHQSALVLSR